MSENPKIRQLSDHVRDTLPRLIMEAQENIIESIDVARESLDDGKELVLAVPVGIKWNLDSNKIEVSVKVAVTHKYTHEGTLDDPDQLQMIDGDGNPLPERMAKPLKEIRRAMKEHGATFEGGAK